MKRRLQISAVSAVLTLLASLVITVSCGSTIIKVPPIKPGEMNQTILINIPPTVDQQRTVQLGNNTSAQIILGPQQSPGNDCLLSDCDENDVACDGLPPCGPVCPPNACSRVNCSHCWQSGFSGPCCWSCCSQFPPYSQQVVYSQQTQQAIPLPYPQPRPVPFPQSQAIPVSQPQPLPFPLPQPVTVSQPQPIPVFQPQPIPVPQPQPIPIPQPQPNPIPFPVPVPQPQPVPFPQPRPVPYPVPVPQPFAVPQSQPIPVQYPQQIQPGAQSRTTYPQPNMSQCRPTPWWPFAQCAPLPPVQPQPTPCYWFQPGCYPQTPQFTNLCYTAGPC